MRIIASDKFEPLVNFWKCAIKNPDLLFQKIATLLPMTKDDFKINLNEFNNLKQRYDRAAMYFALNHASFNGAMRTYSRFGGSRYLYHLPRKMETFKLKNMTISRKSYEEMILTVPHNKDVLLFLDPPYVTDGRHYGWEGELNKHFPHEHLAKMLLRITKKCRWLLCYNDCELVKTLYKGCDMYNAKWFHSMAMSTNKQENYKPNNFELIIVSRALANDLAVDCR